MQLFSIRTRDAFRDACVTLSRTKDDVYNELLKRTGANARNGKSIGDLFETYYAEVDWGNPNSYEPFLAFFAEVYEQTPDSVLMHRKELSERLFEDGLYVESGKLKSLPL